MKKILLTSTIALATIVGAMHIDIKNAQAACGMGGCFGPPMGRGFSFQMSINSHGGRGFGMGGGFGMGRPMFGPMGPRRGGLRRRMGCAGFMPCGGLTRGQARRLGRRTARMVRRSFRGGCFGRGFRC